MASRVLGGWLVVGAILMGGVAAGVGLSRPFPIDEPRDLIVVFAVLGAWGAIHVVAATFVVVDAVRLARRRDLDGLQRAANFVKLIAIPGFMLNFVALALLAGAATVFGARDRAELGLVGPAMAVLFVFLTYLVFLPTSAYGVACLVLMKKDRVIGRAFFGVNMALHLLFVVDVLSAIVVVEVARHLLGTARAPKRVARNLLTGVLLVGSVLASVWLVLVVITLLLGSPGAMVGRTIAALTLASPLECVLLVLVPIVPVVTLRASVRLFLRGDLDALRRATRTVKLVAIPLFIQNFVFCAVIVLALTLLPVVASRGLIIFAGPLAVPIVGAFTSVGLVPAVIGTYLMMLLTSVYGLACLARMLRERAVTPLFFTVNVILHLVFVADIVSTLVVAHRAKQVLRARETSAAPEPSGHLAG